MRCEGSESRQKLETEINKFALQNDGAIAIRETWGELLQKKDILCFKYILIDENGNMQIVSGNGNKRIGGADEKRAMLLMRLNCIRFSRLELMRAQEKQETLDFLCE